MSGLWLVAFGALWALVVLLGVLVLGTLRRVTPIIERAEASLSAAAESLLPGGLPIGGAIPAFSAEDAAGSAFTEADLEGTRTLVLFLSRSCQACESLVEDLEKGNIPELGVRLVVVSDDVDQAHAFSSASAVTVLKQDGRSLARVFESNATPHAFVLDEERRVLASGTPNDWERLRQLLAEARRGGESTSHVAAAAVAS